MSLATLIVAALTASAVLANMVREWRSRQERPLPPHSLRSGRLFLP